MVEVTSQAEDALKKYVKEKKLEESIFKIAMMGYGWGGPRLGLVQGESNDEKNTNSLQFEGVNVVWDDQIDQMSKMYGKLVVDYMKSMVGGKFHVGFAGVSC